MRKKTETAAKTADMKTLKISAQLHAKLTTIVGQLTAESGKIITYDNAVETLLRQSVVMRPEFLEEIEVFIEKNKQFGYLTTGEFLREATRWQMDRLNSIHESPELTKADLVDNGAKDLSITPSISSGGGEQLQ